MKPRLKVSVFVTRSFIRYRKEDLVLDGVSTPYQCVRIQIFFKLIETRQEAAQTCDAASHKLHEICARAVDGIRTRNPLPRAYLSYHLITYTALETPITYSTDVG